jgi:hypothetical protein
LQELLCFIGYVRFHTLTLDLNVLSNVSRCQRIPIIHTSRICKHKPARPSKSIHAYTMGHNLTRTQAVRVDPKFSPTTFSTQFLSTRIFL